MQRWILLGFVLAASLVEPIETWEAAQSTFSLTPDHRVWLEEEVVYIITEREREFFLSLETVEERERFIEAFWQKRDPNGATPENEFKDEHYRRLALANQSLGLESTKPGWKTDRGKMFILLGEPQERRRFDGMNEIVSTELWFYQSERGTGLPSFFYLVFFRPREIGEYRLYHPAIDGPRALVRASPALDSTDPTSIQSTLYDISPELSRASLSLDPSDPGDPRTGRASLGTDILLNRIEEVSKRGVRTDYLDAARRYGKRVSADYSFNFVPNRSVFRVLLTSDASAIVHYSIELDPQDVALETNERQTVFYTTMDVTLDVRDADDNLIYEEEREIYVELTRDQMNRVKAFPFAFQSSFPLVPGAFEVSVLLKNRVMKRFTVAERSIEVPFVSPGSPALSDAIVAFDVEAIDDTQQGAFAEGRYRFRPAADHLFALGETLKAGLRVESADGVSSVRVTLANGTLVRMERVLQIIDFEDGVACADIELDDIDPGTYSLDVELEDAQGSVIARRTTDVRVTPRTAVPRANYVHRGGFDVSMPGLLALARGSQFWAMKRFGDARAELERAVEAGNPELPMARWKLASVYLRTRKADRALELLEPLESDYGRQYEVVAGLGFAHFFKGNFDDAARYLDQAARLRPPPVAVLNALGESYLYLGNIEKAREAFERSLKIQPGQTPIEKHLASMKAQRP